jgi:hypothetical protein
MEKRNYIIYYNGEYRRVREFFDKKDSYDSMIWSARLSTGLFGLMTCSSGNRGPRSSTEVLLAKGGEGLVKLINLGFITCPTCKPENISGFWDTIKDYVKEKYGITNSMEFLDKNFLQFDARRVDWEEMVPIIQGFPSRIYIPPDVPAHELANLEKRLKTLHPNLPEIGYLDKAASPWKFVVYNLS